MKEKTRKILLIGLGILGLGLDIYLIVKNSKLRGKVEELEKLNLDINLKADRAERYIGKLLVETRTK